MKLLGLRRLGYFSAAVGREVGFSMVRKSPVFELDPGRLDHPHWSQGAAMPPEHDP